MKKLISINKITTFKIQLLTLSILALTVFNSCDVYSNTYNSKEFSFHYPSNYSIEEPTDDNPVLTVKSEKGRLEIFKPVDFNGQRIHGFSGTGEEEYEAKLVPKKKLKSGNYEIWQFYTTDDTQTREQLAEIFISFSPKIK